MRSREEIEVKLAEVATKLAEAKSAHADPATLGSLVGMEHALKWVSETTGFPRVGDRVKIVRGEFSGRTGTVAFIDESKSSPIYVSGDHAVGWFTPDEVRDWHEFHKSDLEHDDYDEEDIK